MSTLDRSGTALTSALHKSGLAPMGHLALAGAGPPKNGATAVLFVDELILEQVRFCDAVVHLSLLFAA